jgi:hypothetical protein
MVNIILFLFFEGGGSIRRRVPLLWARVCIAALEVCMLRAGSDGQDF